MFECIFSVDSSFFSCILSPHIPVSNCLFILYQGPISLYRSTHTNLWEHQCLHTPQCFSLSLSVINSQVCVTFRAWVVSISLLTWIVVFRSSRLATMEKPMSYICKREQWTSVLLAEWSERGRAKIEGVFFRSPFFSLSFSLSGCLSFSVHCAVSP